MAFDGAGHLFVVNEATSPNTVTVFTPPLTSTSNPIAILTFPAASTIDNAFGIAFDASGNMWISDSFNDDVYEFAPPFTTTETLPAPTVTMASNADPNGIAFDPAGNLWTGLGTAPANNSVAEWVKPGGGFTNATVQTVFLDGLFEADSIAFDKSGNLYAGSDPYNGRHPRHLSGRQVPAIHPNIVEMPGIGYWPVGGQANGDTPTIVNATGLAVGFNSWQLAFDSAGNLYDADCGTTGQLYVYPTATSAWSTMLAPVVYTDANITASKCVAGVATH